MHLRCHLGNLLFLLFAMTAAGCDTSPPQPADAAVLAPPKRSAEPKLVEREGVLSHHSLSVKSFDAWHGHEFKVDGHPVLATDLVTSERLKQLVGNRVVVRGTMFEGTPFDRADPPDFGAAPALIPGEDPVVMRGWGLRAHEVRPLDATPEPQHQEDEDDKTKKN